MLFSLFLPAVAISKLGQRPVTDVFTAPEFTVFTLFDISDRLKRAF